MRSKKLEARKKLRIQNYYRQWQELDENGAIPETKSIDKQINRFTKITQVWANQLQQNEMEIISMSDTNINTDLDYSTPSDLEYHDRKITPLYRILNNQIFNKGASIVRTKPTKIHHNKENSNIDHLITNIPEKIIQPQIIHSGFSDHYITKFTRITKNPIHHPRYRNMRKFSMVNWSQVKAEIYNDSRLQTTETSTDPQEITTLLTQMIEEIISKQAPIQRIQTNLKILPFITKDTMEVIKQRDQALKDIKLNKNNIDNIRNYKTLRNRAHKLITHDRKNSIKNKFDSAKRDPKKLWNITKDTLGWNSSSSPNTISHKGKNLSKTQRHCRYHQPRTNKSQYSPT